MTKTLFLEILKDTRKNKVKPYLIYLIVEEPNASGFVERTFSVPIGVLIAYNKGEAVAEVTDIAKATGLEIGRIAD